MYDPYLSLLETRGELTDEDIDEMESMWDAGSHLTRPERERDMSNVDMLGASPFEQQQQRA